jgi:Ca-activated chloride channel homolog
VQSKLLFGLVLASMVGLGVAPTAQEPATFRAGASRVMLNVVVKDGRGRPIKDLLLKDFQVLDEGRAVDVHDFRTGIEPVSIALLIDTSGSMRLGPRLATARQAADMLFTQFGPADEAALFTFDQTLVEVVPFSSDLDELRNGVGRVAPFGSTSLHDAVAAAARGLAARPSLRRAVVAITDGFDNSSRLSAVAASGVASSSDVPVYVLAVAASDRPVNPNEVSLEPVEGGGVARLDDLTRRTGGASFDAETPATTLLAVRQILTDLRAGYVLSFTPEETPGWHQLTVRVARKDARVRTRAGFWIGAASDPLPLGGDFLHSRLPAHHDALR